MGDMIALEIHADIHHFFHARPAIDCRENAVTHEEGDEDQIDHWVNKL